MSGSVTDAFPFIKECTTLALFGNTQASQNVPSMSPFSIFDKEYSPIQDTVHRAVEGDTGLLVAYSTQLKKEKELRKNFKRFFIPALYDEVTHYIIYAYIPGLYYAHCSWKGSVCWSFIEGYWKHFTLWILIFDGKKFNKVNNWKQIQRRIVHLHSRIYAFRGNQNSHFLIHDRCLSEEFYSISFPLFWQFQMTSGLSKILHSIILQLNHLFCPQCQMIQGKDMQVL